uniref:Uncharacterized protein n=1 Tax=Marseillevirus LCMAC103 TaxID=2506604 RepID=A0A481YVZ5_9VIRU|nr:MAG: hypothetical protein LCMAC103_04150 [Marseillevirus LCMAC103]
MDQIQVEKFLDAVQSMQKARPTAAVTIDMLRIWIATCYAATGDSFQEAAPALTPSAVEHAYVQAVEGKATDVIRGSAIPDDVRDILDCSPFAFALFVLGQTRLWKACLTENPNALRALEEGLGGGVIGCEGLPNFSTEDLTFLVDRGAIFGNQAIENILCWEYLCLDKLQLLWRLGMPATLHFKSGMDAGFALEGVIETMPCDVLKAILLGFQITYTCGGRAHTVTGADWLLAVSKSTLKVEKYKLVMDVLRVSLGDVGGLFDMYRPLWHSINATVVDAVKKGEFQIGDATHLVAFLVDQGLDVAGADCASEIVSGFHTDSKHFNTQTALSYHVAALAKDATRPNIAYCQFLVDCCPPENLNLFLGRHDKYHSAVKQARESGQREIIDFLDRH